MAEVPVNQVTQADLDEWHRLSLELTKIKTSEMLLRMKIFNGVFINPKEGTNKFDLGGGFQLTATYPIDRKIDPAILASLAPELRTMGIRLDDLVKQKPELSISEYRKLTDEQRKEFDQAITAKPGSPQLKLEQPKRAAAAGFVAPNE